MASFPLALFDNVKDGTVTTGGMWGCLHNSQCQISPRQNIGNDSANFLAFTGEIVGYVDLGFTGTQLIQFTWSYKMCHGGRDSPVGLVWGLGSVGAGDIRLSMQCPTLTTQTHIGVLRVTDGNLTTYFYDTYAGNDFSYLRSFVGDFKLSLTLPTASLTAAVSPTSSSGSTTLLSSLSSSKSFGTSIKTSASASSLASVTPFGIVPPLSISRNGSQTQVASIGGPLPPQIFGEVGGSADTSKTRKIAAGVTGGVLFLLLVALILLWRRRRQNSIQEESQRKNGLVPWMPDIDDQPVGKTAPSGMHDSNQRIVFTKPPLFSVNTPPESMRENPMSAEALRPVEQVPPRAISGAGSPNLTVITALPPSYDMHPYHLAVASRGDDEDGPSLTDALREWAESHRDMVSVDLERRLRAGGFVPGTNPREISGEVWETRFRVTPYELRGLQELYDITHPASL